MRAKTNSLPVVKAMHIDSTYVSLHTRDPKGSMVNLTRCGGVGPAAGSVVLVDTRSSLIGETRDGKS